VAWSIFSDGGGQGAALTWAKDLLTRIGAPQTAGNQQFVYDWEVSEGGGGKYNPLNQGPVPGSPSLTTTGQQYGGGAADFASWSAGLQGAADFLAMPAYAAIREDLRTDQPEAARAALIASPWASSHYGYGSGFSGEAVPGKASALAAGGGAASGGNSGFLGIPGAVTSLGTTLKEAAIIGPVVILGGALVVLGAAKATGLGKRAAGAAETAGKAAVIAA
jgi:hypothetical protein